MNPYRIASVLILTAIGLTSLTACGDDGDSTDTSTTDASSPDGFDSAYCEVSTDWALHEFAGLDESDPAAVEQYSNDLADYVNEAAATAPDEIADDWAVFAAHINNEQVPTLEKYDFSFDRLQTEGTAEEQAAFADPPGDVTAAEARYEAYDAEVCATLQPPAADVQFDGPPPGDYCKAVRTYVSASLEAVYGGGAELEAYVNSPEFAEQQAAVVETAPDEISDDVAAVETFTTDEVLPVLARYGYDAKRLFREGSYDERIVFLNSDERVIDPYVQVRAYNRQLCDS